MGILSSKHLCRKCGKKKSPSDFHRDSSRRDGLHPYCKACVKAYHAANAAVLSKRAQEWQKANPERARDAVRKYYQSHPQPYRYRYRISNDRRRELSRGYSRRWAAANPQKRATIRSRRRAALAGQQEHFTKEQWATLCQQFGEICLCCRERKPLTPDHINPLSRGGSNNINNIQPLCLDCNRRKGAKNIDYRTGGI